MPNTDRFSAEEVTVQQTSRLRCSSPFTTLPDPSMPQRPQLQQCSSDTLRVRVLLTSPIREIFVLAIP